jgi:hypothetical protein
MTIGFLQKYWSSIGLSFPVKGILLKIFNDARGYIYGEKRYRFLNDDSFSAVMNGLFMPIFALHQMIRVI